MWAIFHKSSKRYVLLPLDSGGNGMRKLVFEYPIQASKYIQKHLGNSNDFEIVELKKEKKSVIKCAGQMTK